MNPLGQTPANAGLLFDPEAGYNVSPPRRFVQVAVERPLDKGTGSAEVLTYLSPEQPVMVGQRVRVPLGRGGSVVGGFVIAVGSEDLLGTLPPDRARPVASVEAASLSPTLVTLGVWMAQYYAAPLGLVLSGMMPASVKRGTGTRNVRCARLAAAPFDLMKLPPRLRDLAGQLRSHDDLRRGVPLEIIAQRLDLRTPARLRTLARLGVLEEYLERSVRAGPRGFDPVAATPCSAAPTHALTPDQTLAIAAITPDVDAHRFRAHLLLGVTGSGKTEVYLQLIARALATGRAGLVLVPEIALTPQTSARFVARFGGGVVSVLHSGLSAARRHEAWRRAARGECKVVVGARSAVFAPLRALGIIIVDEEHDGSYKQDQTPRYHARDVALKRASIEGCPVVLGSATPALESYANASAPLAEGGTRFTLTRMPRRVPGAALPTVRIVDIREERAARARAFPTDALRQHLLGPTLEEALARTLGARAQAMLLLNRRGLAQRLACPAAACGFLAMCDGCDASLVLHKHAAAPAGTIVRCHHCHTDTKVPALCPACGKRLVMSGGGTQKLEEELVRSFASLGLREEHILRVDSDTMRGARDYFEAMERFASGEARVLVGTQMIAKGLDFAGVRLVGVIDADTALALPDFRAAERTHQLVSQVAGRAGRADASGLVIVQTASPGHRAIVLAAQHDYETFAREELLVRTRAGLPPTSRMARITVRDKAEQTCMTRAQALANVLARDPSVAEGLARVETPSPALIARVAHEYRWAFNIFAAHAGVLRAVLSRARGAGHFHARTGEIIVDVDPVVTI